MGSVQDRVNYLTLDAGARQCATYIEQLFAAFDDCCGGEGPPLKEAQRKAVEEVRAGLIEARAAQAELVKRIDGFTAEFAKMRADFAASTKQTPSQPASSEPK
jgi:hypothetical protein